MLTIRNIAITIFTLAIVVGCVREDPDSYNPEGGAVDYEDYREPADLTVVVDMEKLIAGFENDSPSTRADGTQTTFRWLTEEQLPAGHYDWTRYNPGGSSADKTFWENNTSEEKYNRHTRGHNRIKMDEITSLAFFVVDMQLNADGSQPRRWGRIVAYRLFLSHRDGARNTLPDNETGSVVEDSGTEYSEAERRARKYFFFDPDNVSGYQGQLNNIKFDRPELAWNYDDDFVNEARAEYLLEQGKISSKEEYLACGRNGFALQYSDGTLMPDDGANNSDWGTGEGFYLFDEEGKMVASKAMIMTFKYDNPLHKTANNVEKLRRGDVWILAIANFHMLPTTYKGHPAGWFVKEVVDYWHRNKDRDDFHGVPANVIAEAGYNYILMNPNASTGEAETTTRTNEFMGYRLMADAALRQNDTGISPAYPIDNDYTNDKIGRVGSGARNGEFAAMIRHYKPMILSSSDMQTSLTPGENIFRSRLKRIASHVTFYITNQSKQNLTIEHFGVSSNFAQAATWIFPHDKSPDTSVERGNYFALWQDSLDVWSNKALIPFRVRTYPTMNTPEAFFEALTYESKSLDGSPMTYDLTVAYRDAKIEHPEVQEKWEVATDWTRVDDLKAQLASNDNWPVGTSKLFLLQSSRWGTNGSNFIFRETTKSSGEAQNIRGMNPTSGSTITNISQAVNQVTKTRNHNFIWELVKVDNSHVRIRNYGTKEYLQNPSGNHQPYLFIMEDDKDFKQNVATFLVDHWVHNLYPAPANTVGFLSGSHYLAMLNTTNTNYMVVTENSYNDVGAHFYPYEVTDIPYSAAWTEVKRKALKKIPIRVFDKASGIAETLTEIKRNDHINVQINVTYNTEQEDIEIQVRDWATSDNDLSFE